MVNYNIAYSKMAYKYLFKAFYNSTNKKKYKLQIWMHNIWYINIIAMKNVIVSKKTRKKKLSKSFVDTIALAEVI